MILDWFQVDFRAAVRSGPAGPAFKLNLMVAAGRASGHNSFYVLSKRLYNVVRILKNLPPPPHKKKLV